MKQKKKNGVFTWFASLIPGAAEMYMGFMKMGISMMLCFGVVALMIHITGMDVLAVGFPLVWFYSYFHARNLYGSSEEEFFAVEDHYIWEEFLDRPISFAGKSRTVKRCLSILLIVVGVSTLWSNLQEPILRMIPEDMWKLIYPFVHTIPRIFIAIFMIAAGVWLVKGKKEEQNG